MWAEFSHDDIFGKAAELSYYFLLALFPALLFIVSLLGLLAGPGTELRATLFQTLSSIVPRSSSELVVKTVNEVASVAGGGKLTFGILTALWAASGGLSALMSTLNAAYEVKETRGWIKSHAIALALTLELTFLIIVALTLVLFGGRLATAATTHFGWHGFAFILQAVQWPLVLGALLLAFASIYYFAPNLSELRKSFPTHSLPGPSTANAIISR